MATKKTAKKRAAKKVGKKRAAKKTAKKGAKRRKSKRASGEDGFKPVLRATWAGKVRSVRLSGNNFISALKSIMGLQYSYEGEGYYYVDEGNLVTKYRRIAKAVEDGEAALVKLDAYLQKMVKDRLEILWHALERVAA